MDKEKEELHWFEKLPKKKREQRKRRANNEGNPASGNRQQRAVKKEVNLVKYVNEVERWIDEVSAYLKTGDRKDWAWNALRGVLQGLRDRVPPAEVFQLSAQFPMLIRGLFLEGYQLGNKPEKFNRSELETRIDMAVGPAVDFDSSTAFKAVLLVLYDHVSEGELQDVYATLPKDIRQLWDSSLEKHSV
ncbi:DUF2267 domain-containing protein [Halalkalibaculum sp. DA384]|uniref:DUF2267 domain-containing protein n=1 Tax=Halalkalibaculum sp. DA384 TaxID=3373606 RepID=UPI00375459E5